MRADWINKINPMVSGWFKKIKVKLAIIFIKIISRSNLNKILILEINNK